MKSSIFCLLLLSLLVGCVDVRNKDPENAPVAPAAPQPAEPTPAPVPAPAPKEIVPEAAPLPPDVKIEVVPSPYPHKYVAVFSDLSAFAAIRKISPGEPVDGSGSPILALDKSSQGFRDSELMEASNYVYQIGDLSKTGFTVQQTREITVPKDFVIDSAFHLNTDSDRIEIVGYARVYLLDRTVLSTFGRSLNIQAETLIAQNAEIQTYPAGTAANSGQPGRPGGSITIRANRLQGHLTVALRGQNGAYGADGPPYDKPAKSAVMDTFATSDFRRESICNNGAFHPAENGMRGVPGGDGTDGGSSGSLSLQANDTTNFDLNTQVLPGRGGNPGRGGPGQRGGQVGPVGCNNVTMGIPGTDGLPGPDGRAGADGRAESVCIQLKDQTPSCR